MATITRRRSSIEFIGLLSMIMALTALSIDLLLPAFPEVRAEYGLAPDSTGAAALVTTFLLGLAVAQGVYGPFADRFGRKPVLFAGCAAFAAGAVGSALAPTFGWLLGARFLWGAGAAGPRVLAITIVRDRYEGDQMSRVISFIMAVFVIVPIVAPAIGAGIVAIAPWRWVFWACVAYVAVVALWSLRLEETLDPAHRIELRFNGIERAARIVFGNRVTMGYMVALTALFGAFVSYLASSELIWDDVYDRGTWFPYIFGGLALVMGAMMLVNAAVVGRVGTRRMVHGVLYGYLVASLAVLVLTLAYDGVPPLWPYLAGLAVMVAMHALLIPNLNAEAMRPMGSVAGTASAVIGTVSTGAGAVLGAVVDRTFAGTVTPLSIGFAAAAVVAVVAARWAAATS